MDGQNRALTVTVVLLAVVAGLLAAGMVLTSNSNQELMNRMTALETRMLKLEKTANYPVPEGNNPEYLEGYDVPQAGQALIVNASLHTKVTSPFIRAERVGNVMVYIVDVVQVPTLNMQHTGGPGEGIWGYAQLQSHGRYMITDHSAEAVNIQHIVPSTLGGYARGNSQVFDSIK